MDGSCRHVIATLFEIIDYMQDFSKQSCTSNPCQWVKRQTWSLDKPPSVPVVELCTSLVAGGQDLTRYVLPQLFLIFAVCIILHAETGFSKIGDMSISPKNIIFLHDGIGLIISNGLVELTNLVSKLSVFKFFWHLALARSDMY